MEMTDIRYFLAVCETLNFHRAAERCHVTQPALTRAVQKLEADLGSPLFCRDKGKVQLTEFGRMMRPHLQDVIGRRDHVRTVARARSRATHSRGHVHNWPRPVRRLLEPVSGEAPGNRDNGGRERPGTLG